MRKSDKKLNISKVNLLAEQRYLESKGLISESFHNQDGTPIGVDHMHRPVNEEEIIGDDFWQTYNTSAQEQKEICWNMIQHFKSFDAAIRENKNLLKNAIDNGNEASAKILNFRLQYMENNRELLDTSENPFFNK